MVILKKEIFPFAATWVDPESMMLSEISQQQMLYGDITFTWHLKEKKKTELKDAGNRWVVDGQGDGCEMDDKGPKEQTYRDKISKSQGVMCNVVIRVTNTVMQTWKLLRVILQVIKKKKKRFL